MDYKFKKNIMKKLLLIALFSTSLLSNAQIAPYCINTYTTGVEPITSVVFAGINNSSPATTAIGTSALAHQNYTTVTGNVIAGNTYPITVKGNTDGNFNDNIVVFCDWNRDNDFIDAGETFNIGSILNSTGLDAISAAGSIQIPGNVTAGNVRMRVLKSYNSCNASFDLPCRIGDGYGQSEDYKLVVTVPAFIAPGVGTAVVNVPFLTADLSWAAGGSTNNEILVLLASLAPPANTPNAGIDVVGTTYTASSSLIANTKYKFYIRSEYTVGTDYSQWSGPFFFDTFEPSCTTVIAPVNGATGVTANTAAAPTAAATFTWAEVPGAQSYDYYYGNSTTPNVAGILLGNYDCATTRLTIPGYNATYYWRIVPIFSNGPATGCPVWSFTTQQDPLLSNNEFLTKNFSIYPNPANDIVNISKNNNIDIKSVTITDINGRVVKEIVANEIAAISIADLTAGVYLLKIVTAEGTGTTKLIKN